jgi:hypothetical protein
MSDFRNDNPMTVDMTTITEDQAVQLYFRLALQFGWGGTFFTREDAESTWDIEANGPFTDEVWEAIRLTWYWRKGLTEILTERGFDLVSEAITEVAEAREASK